MSVMRRVREEVKTCEHYKCQETDVELEVYIVMGQMFEKWFCVKHHPSLSLQGFSDD